MLLFVLLSACAGSADPAAPGPDSDPVRVPLRWVRAFDGDTFERAEAGLRWSLALLGAAPSDALLVDVEVGPDEARFALDLGSAGFPDAARPHVDAAVAPLLASEEVALRGTMDLGRFLTLTLHSPGRYYAITGACATRGAWESERLGLSTGQVEVTESLLVDGTRWLTYASEPVDARGIAVSAVQAGEDEQEVLDVMENGFVRYAVYGPDGGLAPASAHSPAGQPARCAWCHEMNLLRPAASDPAWAALDALLDPWEDALLARQRAAAGHVDLDTYEVHEMGEQLGLFFLEPTVGRVAREWGTTEEAVRALGLPEHASSEYPEAGPLLRRSDVDAASPLPGAVLPVPEDGRSADPMLTLDGAEQLVGCR
jgi:hypothetical protein